MKKVRIIKPLIWTIIITAAVYAIVVTVSSVLLYQRVWAPEAKYESLLYTSDDTLGFKSIPNSSGQLILCAGDTVPIKFDDFGFRIPSTGKSITFTPDSVDVLYLGCSFTFGYGCRAEDTYPHLVSKTNGVSYINAAVSAYGLSQMYLLAERLIPQYRPRFVVLQRSSWLPYRGIDPFNRVDQGLLTVPYFSNPSENPRLLFPIEKSLVFELVEARESGKLSSRMLQFLFGFGFSHVVKEHFLYAKARLRMLLNPSLQPATDVAQVEQVIYQRISDIALANGSFPIVLSVGYRWNDAPKLSLHGTGRGPMFINADSLLVGQLGIDERLNPTPEEYDLIYDRAYSHWQVIEKDSFLIDNHPNETAHRIIADALMSRIAF